MTARGVWYAALFVSTATMLSAHAEEPRWAAPPIEDCISVRDAQNRRARWDELLTALSEAQVVFVGETHDDETTHRAELALLDGLLERRAGAVVLALEMFERDVQPVLEAYLVGRIDERQFLSQSRPWANYATAYRPLIERAREKGIPVYASNFPRPLVATVAQAGADWRQALTPEQENWVAEQLLPQPDEYWRRVENAVRGHAGFLRQSDRLLSTQSLWDNTMADTCAKLLEKFPDRLILHINGDFHSAYRQGVVHQLLERKPHTRIATVSLHPVSDTKSARWIGKPPADFVLYVLSSAKEKEEGYYRVTASKDVKYLLHVPESSGQRRFPLLIALPSDGLRAADAMEWWKWHLGDEAAIVAIEPFYRETEPDRTIGGRWFWIDSFDEDIPRIVDVVEEIWGYVCRQFPMEPERVVVVGEASAGTAAVAAAVWTERAPLRSIALSPAHYAKLRDLPLPLPELWGNDPPPRRAVELLVKPDDQAWWKQELAEYDAVGITTALHTIPADPARLDAWYQAARRALGLPSINTKALSRTEYLVLPAESPRAEHWGRMQSLWLTQEGVKLVVSRTPPAEGQAVRSTELVPESFLADDALPRCPGPFGGTTVLVLPPHVPASTVQAWLKVEQKDPLARQSRFHRVRVATLGNERTIEEVLTKLESEQRRNVLVVPAVFYAHAEFLQAINERVRPFENRMTFHWLPGLGGSRSALAKPLDEKPIHYRIRAKLNPAEHQLIAVVNIELPEDLRQKPLTFRLDGSATVRRSNIPLQSEKAEVETRWSSPNSPEVDHLELEYEAKFDYALTDQKSEYTRGFRQTRGWIGPEGVYLAGESLWLPTFADRLVTFELHVEQPEGWHSISQGSGHSRGENGEAHWVCRDNMEEVYLVGGPLIRYRDTAGSIELAVYLRTDDPGLAKKYLTTGAQYLELYRKLFGPYPYTKFSLVENFWETGFGMPSFTLLGPQVIRFPFILHSSYPHEILHNWWGNGVFVDYSRGNWCEGLTAYLADHLVQEQRGTGAEYRRNTLQRYRDYVAVEKDFPLATFHERHSSATEAVGYAKAMMLFHMVRRSIGDEAFRRGLAEFYRRHRGKRASVDQLFACWEETSERPFSEFLRAWWDAPGAPRLEVKQVEVSALQHGKHGIRGYLRQSQPQSVYPLDVPIYVRTEGGTVEHRVRMTEREARFELQVEGEPVALYIDPQFDVMRILDPRETPPTLSGLFGQEQLWALLPRAASAEAIAGYQRLIEIWQTDEHRIEVHWDDQIDQLPKDRSVWIFGWENKWLETWLKSASCVAWNHEQKLVRFGTDSVDLVGRTVVAVVRHPERTDRVLGWLSVDRPAAFEGVGRKLPHYGKYSYLVFEGDEPTNTIKGQWAVDDSPLIVDLRSNRPAPLEPFVVHSQALADLPPAFSGQALHEHVRWLADPQREGRGVGTKGLEDAARYIRDTMAEIGLQPGGDGGSYFQVFSVRGPTGQPLECKNVIGVLPGRNPQWKDQCVILCAHYDHLGKGWPDVRSGNEGEVHPGADDNASGVAVMLEVARALSEQGCSRTLVVIAFSAEEMGRLGSRYYVDHPVIPLIETRAVVNLDTVGRLRDQPILVLGTGTADEWVHIVRGCSYVTGIPSRAVDQDVGGSDQLSFVDKGIPAIQLFTGAHEDYHRPSDTVDKVDIAGLAKVAAFVKEAVEYLLERPEPLTVRIGPPAESEAARPQRRAAFGIVPEYDFAGPGVKVASVLPDSPAARAGVLSGDILIEWDGRAVDDLRKFAALLRAASPGQTVKLRLLRKEKTVELRAQLDVR